MSAALLFRSLSLSRLSENQITLSEAASGGGSVRKGTLRNFAKFTGKHLCQSLFFNLVAELSPATLLKKKLWDRCFPVNFAKFCFPYRTSPVAASPSTGENRA